MPITEKTRKALEELGLTGYEIKSYVALIEYGPLTATEISRSSGVPFSKIYEVLGSLENKGWIEAEHSRPSRFYPRSPSTALETMRMKLENERRRNETQVLYELAPIYEKRGSKERPEIWIMRGEYNILSKLKETLSDCERELLIALPPIMNFVVEVLDPIMTGMRDRGVEIMILASEETSQETLLQMNRWGEVRTREQMYGGGVIADSRQVILLLTGEREPGSSLAIWADHTGLAGYAKNYFEYLWNDSKPFLSSKKTT